jgi:peroxiredoxin
MHRRAFLMAAGVTIAGDGFARAAAYDRKELRDHQDGKTSLSRSASGHRLVVVTMKGTWCQVCVAQLERLAKLRDALESRGARVVAITVEPAKKNAALAKRLGLPFPILSDPKHRIVEQLGLWLPRADHPMPATVVFDRCGTERARLRGRRPGQRPEPQLLAFLRKLQEKPARCELPAV